MDFKEYYALFIMVEDCKNRNVSFLTRFNFC